MMVQGTEPAYEHIACLILETTGTRPEASELDPLHTGASGRLIVRYQQWIAIYWTAARADNAAFPLCAQKLHQAGIAVPQIHALWLGEEGEGACLCTDLGPCDLYSYKEKPWAELKEAYRLSFQTLLPFYQLDVTWPLQAPFDESLYQWEQEYFAQHYLQNHRQLSPQQSQELVETAPFRQLIQELCTHQRVPIHRDCQSQNIMIQEGRAWLIDFQGMRMGLKEYDLASLIYDPYMDLNAEQRQELCHMWEELSHEALDYSLFSACGQQRLMQALGAFANIGYNQGREWYLQQIPAGERALAQISALAPLNSPAYNLALCLKNVKNP